MPLGDLAQVLRGLPSVQDDRLLVGHGTFDDAGIFRLDAERALVQTVDFFPPVVDDPFRFGQVAAANALSDVYAMGGAPLTALGIVAFPLGELPLDTLREILRGGAEKCVEAGAVVVGGHSINEKELKFGLSVTGIIHPRRIASNAGAQPGDILFLTKPLGIGPVTAAFKQGHADEALMNRAADQMATLNKAAAEAMCVVGINEPEGIHAATDVTGYGLLGHARNIALASHATLSFDIVKVPIFENALDFARRKLFTRAMKQNRALLGEHVEIAPGLDEDIQNLVFDSETSGGLLIAVAPQSAGRLASELRQRGVACIAEIGQVLPLEKRILRLR